MSAEREYLYKMGIPIDEEWVVQEMSVKSDISTEETEADVYGNTYDRPLVLGKQITLVVYRTEN